MQKQIVKWVVFAITLTLALQAAKLLVFAVHRAPSLEVMRNP
jgi:hypothetical protein